MAGYDLPKARESYRKSHPPMDASSPLWISEQGRREIVLQQLNAEILAKLIIRV